MIRVGLGFDAHALVPGRRLRLGGVDVPSECGLEGHSDGDAAAHAVADALLGAARMGDLGALFPSDDPEHRGADSLGFLREIAARLTTEGWAVNNVDVVIVAQKPRLAGHTDSMSAAISAALGIPTDAVSVHAKTTDHLGFAGRGEGIAAMAAALVRRGEGTPDEEA
jgi:2-C-methyl-D-erythritol 2,4-cyclodiphosphate synthase